jgi:hypothetical protein
MKLPFVLLLSAAAAPLAPPLVIDTVLIDFSVTPGPDGMLGTPDDVPIQNDLGVGGELDGSEFESVGVRFGTPERALNIGCSAGAGSPENCLGADMLVDDDFDGLLTADFIIQGGPATVATLRLDDVNNGSTTTLFDSSGAVIDVIVGDVAYLGPTPVARFETRFVFSAIHDMEFSCLEPVAECFLVIADRRGSAPFSEGGFTWTTQLGGIHASHAVLLDDIPVFPVPVSGGRKNLLPLEHLTVQVVMHNPEAFPANPVQWTNGLEVLVGPNGYVRSVPYGSSNGMSVWVETFQDSTGNSFFRFPFSIDGL